MNDYQQRLLNDMLSKLYETKTYRNISVFLTLLFIFDFVLVLLGYAEFNITYFLILVVTFIGNNHMNKKYRVAIKEYEKLKEEYENTI